MVWIIKVISRFITYRPIRNEYTNMPVFIGLGPDIFYIHCAFRSVYIYLIQFIPLKNIVYAVLQHTGSEFLK